MESTIADFPACIRVIGFGRQMAQTISDIRTLGYDGVRAEMYSDNTEYSPTDEDIMVIILGNPNSERVRSLAKTFFDADVLTIVILYRNEKIPSDCIDAYTVIEQGKETEVIKSLVEPIFAPCRISFDFNDLKLTLADMYHFLVLSGTGQGRTRVPDAIANATKSLKYDQISHIERLSILLYNNDNDRKPLAMEELSSLSEFMKSLPESIEIIWALYQDESIDNGTIRISIISAGKNLKFD